MAAPLQRSGEYDFFFRMSPSALDQWWTLRTLVMSLCRLCPHFSHPSNLQDRTSAWLLTSPFYGGAESRGQIRDLRTQVSADAARKNPLSKHAAPRLRAAFCRVQSPITWLLTHSHDTSPSSVAAVSGRHCSLIHTIPAPQQRSAVCRGHSHSHEASPTSEAAVGRVYTHIHMIPAPHQRRPCVEDSALSLIQGDMAPRGAKESPHPPAQKSTRR